MAIVVSSPTVRMGYIANAVSADIQACETILAKTTDKSIKIKHLTINSTAAISIWIGEGAAAGTIDNNLIGPLDFAALQTMQWDFWPLLELTSDYLLLCDADGAGQVCIFAQGFIS